MALSVTLLAGPLGQDRPKAVDHGYYVDALATITVYEADVVATARIVGVDTLGGESGTSFKLVNADDTIITFTTNPTKNFGDTVTETESPFTVNTGGSFSSAGIRKATQALWISCKAAIDAGVLNMTINPTTVAPIASGQEYFILTQTVDGTSGNTAITLITGVTANGETAFINGANADIVAATDLGLDTITAATITGNSQAALYTADIKCNDTGSYAIHPGRTADSIQLHLLDNSDADDAEVADGTNITDTTLRLRVWGSM
jgi:hypothetical protein